MPHEPIAALHRRAVVPRGFRGVDAAIFAAAVATGFLLFRFSVAVGSATIRF
jgi:hypothetical protein